MRLIYSRRAISNLEEIREYIAFDNPAAAKRLIRKVMASASQLKEFPNMGRPGKFKNTRELVIGGTPYIIVYRALESTVQIIAVIHGSRDWML